jgi:glutathione S-transferase
MPMLQLYYKPGACSLADHIVLEWVGAKYSLVEMNRDSLQSASFLALNPSGSVPVFKHGDFVLTQNVAILHYLSEIYPSARLLGGDTPRERAEVMRWLAFLNSDVHKAFKPLYTPKHQTEDDASAELHANAARRQIRAYLKRFDQQLESRAWITGIRSVADPYLFVVVRWAVATQIDLGGLHNLAAFASRMHSDEGVRAALFAEEGIVI